MIDVAAREMRPRILFVEDERTVREHIAEALADEFVVDTAADGEQALHVVLRIKPELIVTDIVMPTIDGVELVRTLRNTPSTAAIPVLLISGRAPEELRFEGLKVGADGYLAKPYTERELRLRIRSMLHNAQLRMDAARREVAELAEQRVLAERAALLDSITDGFYAVDRRWRFTYVNQVAANYTRVAREALLGKAVWEVFPSMRGTVYDREYHRAMHEQRSVAFEAWSDLSQRWLDVHAYPTPHGLAIHFRDITDRKRVDESLRKSEERYRAFVANSTEAIWRYELDEPLDMSLPLDEQVEHVYRYAHVAESNDALARIYGKTHADELLDRPISKMLSPDPAVARAHLRELAAAGFFVTNAESQQHTVQGRRLYFSSSLVPVIENGKLLRVWGTQRNITERKEVERLLLDNEQRKDEFLAVLAHELRNPLAPVRNGLQILRLRASSDSILQGTVAMMDRQMTHLVRLVDDLLDVSRITRGKLELRRQHVLLADVLANAIEATGTLIESNRHELRVDMRANDLYLHGDPNRLAQVFSNLISNSAKYTPAGGKIVVTLERKDDVALITIQDNGVGIERNALERIFEMFSQVESHAGRADGGLGIGLALVRMLVELHGGRVEASSGGVGQGSTFRVRLPITPAPAQAAHPGSAPSLEGSQPKRVLVVDDNADAATSLAMLLRMHRHEIRTAADGIEAVELAREFQPHVIFMDLGMPRMDGLEATRRIRAFDRDRKILIVALTGWGQESDRQRTREAGIDEHLVKPVSIEALERVLAIKSEH